MKNILFFVNDFGFGPASRAATIARAVLAKNKNLNIRLVGSGMSDYLFGSDLPIDNIVDLRSEECITKYISKFEAQETLVVSTMNRFAILAASRLGIGTVLVDGLYWFWKQRPSEYDTADYQIKCVLPWLLDAYKNESTPTNLIVASPIELYDTVKEQNAFSGRLVNANGYLTPFHSSGDDVYLDYLSAFLNASKTETLITTSPYAISYLKKYIINNKVSLDSLDKKTYQSCVSSAKEIFLNGGSNSFLEVLNANKPFAFFMPSNQSQYALIKEVSHFTGIDINILCPVLIDFPTFYKVSEYDTESSAIEYITSLVNEYMVNGNIMNLIEKSYHKYDGAAITIFSNIKVKQMILLAKQSISSTDTIATYISGLIPK